MEFELFTHYRYAGNCTVLDTYGSATRAQYCMEICLDTEYCRGKVNGWMDGWVDGWMDGWMYGWVNG